MILEVLINGSITGYIFALTYLSFSSHKKYLISIITLSFIVVILLVGMFDISFDVSGVWLKIVSQFDSLNNNADSVTRLSGGINSIKRSFDSFDAFIGAGLSWENPTLDFISLYLHAFGMIGLLALVTYSV